MCFHYQSEINIFKKIFEKSKTYDISFHPPLDDLSEWYQSIDLFFFRKKKYKNSCNQTNQEIYSLQNGKSHDFI